MSLKKSYLILQNGFLRVSCLKCGLYPLNADEFTYMLYVNTSIKQLINAEKKKEKKKRKKKEFWNVSKEKNIMDKNLTIFCVNCDSLQLHFLKNIWIVLCLTFCNLGVSIFPIYSFSITFICLSP